MRIATIGEDGQIRDADGRVFPSDRAMELWPRPGRYAPRRGRRTKRPSSTPFIENSIRTGDTYPRPGRYVTVSGNEPTQIGPWGPLPYPQRDPLRPMPQHVAQPWGVSGDAVQIGPWGPLPYPQRDPLRPMPQHVAQPWGLAQATTAPPDFYPQDQATSAYQVALDSAKPAEAMAFSRKPGDPESIIYPGRFVVLRPDAQLKTQNGQLLTQAYPRTLWGIAFRPPETENPLSVRLLSTEGKAIGSYIEIEVRDLLTQFLVVPKLGETAVRVAIRQVAQPWIDDRMAPDRVSVYNLIALLEQATFQLVSMPFERHDVAAFKAAFPSIQGNVVASMGLVVDALDMVGAAYDFDTIGRKAFNIVVCVATEVFNVVSDLFNKTLNQNPDQASINAFYAKIDQVMDVQPYWAALLARANLLTSATALSWMTTGYDFIRFFQEITSNASLEMELDPNSFLKFAMSGDQPVADVTAQEYLRQGTDRLKKLTAENDQWNEAFQASVIRPFAKQAGIEPGDLPLMLTVAMGALDENKKRIIALKKTSKGSTCAPGLGAIGSSAPLGELGAGGQVQVKLAGDLALNAENNFRKSVAGGGGTAKALKATMRALTKYLESIKKTWESIITSSADLEVRAAGEVMNRRAAILAEKKTAQQDIVRLETEIDHIKADPAKKAEVERLREQRNQVSQHIRNLDKVHDATQIGNAAEVRQAMQDAGAIIDQAVAQSRFKKDVSNEQNVENAVESLRILEQFLTRGVSKVIRQPTPGQPGELQFMATEAAGVALGGQGTFWKLMNVIQKGKFIDDGYLPVIAKTYAKSLGLNVAEILNGRGGLNEKLARVKELQAKTKSSAEKSKLNEKEVELLERINLLKAIDGVEVLRFMGDVFLRAQNKLTLAEEKAKAGQTEAADRNDAQDARGILKMLELMMKARKEGKEKGDVAEPGGYFREDYLKYKALKDQGLLFREGTEEFATYKLWEEAFNRFDRAVSVFAEQAPKIIKQIEDQKVGGEPIDYRPLGKMIQEVQSSMNGLRELHSQVSEIAGRFSWRRTWDGFAKATKAYVSWNLNGYGKVQEVLKNNAVGKAVWAFTGLPITVLAWAIQLSLPLYVLTLFGFPRILVPTILLQKVFETFFGISNAVLDFTKGDRQLDPFTAGEGSPEGMTGATRMLLMGLGISMIFFGDKVFPAFGQLFTATSKVLENSLKLLGPKKKGAGKGGSGRGPGRPRKEEAVSALKGLPPELLGYIFGGR